MKNETLECLTDNLNFPRYNALKIMAGIIVHNSTYRLNAEDAKDRAWASLAVWLHYGLWEWSYLTIRAMGGVVNTITELVLYFQENF